MTKDEALNKVAFLDQVAAQSPVGRGVHVQVQVAVTALQQFIAEADAPTDKAKDRVAKPSNPRK